jgi:hypothetical protein
LAQFLERKTSTPPHSPGPTKMLLSKKKFLTVQKVIDKWHIDNIIDTAEAHRLKSSIELSKFDWKRLAKYSFWIAGISLAISVFAVLLDDAIMAILK